MKKNVIALAALIALSVVLSGVESADAQVIMPLPPDPTPVIRMGVDATPFAPGASGYPMTITLTNLGPRRGLVTLAPLDMGFLGWGAGETIKSLSADSGFVCGISSDTFGCNGSLPYGSTVTIKAIVKPDPCTYAEVHVTDYLPSNHRWNGDSTFTLEMASAPCTAD